MSANIPVTEKELFSWIEQCLDSLKFANYHIQVTGGTNKTEGYSGDVAFVSVAGERNGKKENLDLAVKYGKRNPHMREAMPFREAFEREIFMYDSVFKVFQAFQSEKHVKNGFDSVPKCYKTLVFDDMEVLIFRNLRKDGFQLYDRKKALNFEHVKCILTEYGKLHALSFALRDQKPEEYEKLTARIAVNLMKTFMLTKGLGRTINKKCKEAPELLKDTLSEDLLNKFEKSMEKGGENVLLELLDPNEQQTVITHGDCWNNNFLYQYQEQNQNTPHRVAILDWQVSGVSSPVHDLSYFLLVSASREVLERFEEILEIYYESFSNFLSALGSDPEKLFSFADLKRHWKKYSAIGMIFAVAFLSVVLCEEDNAPAFEELEKGQTMADIIDVKIDDTELLKERVGAAVKYYLQNLN